MTVRSLNLAPSGNPVVFLSRTSGPYLTYTCRSQSLSGLAYSVSDTSKGNKSGHRLLTDPLILLWVVTEVKGKAVTRLLLAKGYDGSRRGVPGLGHQIWALSNEADEDGSLLGDPAHPEFGVQICVTKKQVTDAKYPSYQLKRGGISAPIKDMFDLMNEEEREVLTPLEDVVHVPTEDEEQKLLENVIDLETECRIRDSDG